jgi:catechol 2,3-dioxygenase-like lactoylglutathione lyase family enzyme
MSNGATTGQQHVNFTDEAGNVWELVYKDNSGWGSTNLTVVAQPSVTFQVPTAAPFSPLDGYATGWNNQQHVNFLDKNWHVGELVYEDGSGWRFTDLTGAAHALVTAAPGSRALDGYATDWNNQQHVNFIDFEGSVWELVYKDGIGWDSTNLTGAAKEWGSVPAAPGSVLDGYVTGWNNQQHVNFLDDQGNVGELVYKDGFGWDFTNLTSTAQSANPKLPRATTGSALDGYVTAWNSQQHVNFIDDQGNVWELVYQDGIGWWSTNLTAAANSPYPAALDSPLDGYVTAWNNQQHVNFIDNEGNVWELAYQDGGGWWSTNLTVTAQRSSPVTVPAAAPDSALDGYASGWNNQQHVNFLDGHGNVGELVYKDDGGWTFTPLTQDTPGSAVAAGKHVDGYVTT